MTAAPNQKRRLRNLLINKRYQLRFTAFLVGVASLLMVGLGILVMRVADEAAGFARNNLTTTMENECKSPDAQAAEPAPATNTVPPSAPGRTVVVIEESTILPTVDPAVAQERVSRCRNEFMARLGKVENQRQLILWTLWAIGVALVLGLSAYGIKMTHRVAGPLFKISRYLVLLRDGRYEPILELRRGDQLGEFYDHFKKAHAGLKQMQMADVVRIKETLAQAREQKLAEKSPELATAMTKLTEVLERKERSLG